MKKNLRKSIIFVLFCGVMLSTAMFIGCNNPLYVEPKVTFVTQEINYLAGEGIDCFNFIERQEGVTYSFKVKKVESSREEPVSGRTYFAKSSGEYILICTATAGKKTETKSTEFTVYDTKPFLLVKGTSTIPYSALWTKEDCVPLDKIFTASDSNVEYTIDSVTVYKNPYVYNYYISGKQYIDGMEKDIVEYDLTKPSNDGFFDGEYISFMYEGYYEFVLTATNAGGSVTQKFVANVKENVKLYSELPNVHISYDYYTDEFACWDVVEGATNYRVKVDYENVYTDETNSKIENGKVYFDVKSYLSSEYAFFQSFDLVVLPLDEQGKNITYGGKVAKITCKNVSVAPEEQKYATFGLNSTVEYDNDKEIATVNVLGQRAKGLGATKISETDNGYVAWKGDFGIGNYVSFTFKGNNIPNVCLFADEINGDMSYKGGEGLIIVSGLNGLYKSGGHYNTIYSDSLIVFGPNRINGGTNPTGTIWDSYLTRLTGSRFEKFTQAFLSNDTTGTEYKYVVGTFSQGDYVYLDLRLYEVTNGNETIIHNQHVATNIHKSQLSGGNIIAFAPLKENAANSSFTFGTPYKDTPIPMSNRDESVVSSGATFNGDGSVTLDGMGLDGFDGQAHIYALSRLSSSYIAWEGNYGVGNYVEFEFTGNNMPNIMFFADKINGSLVDFAVDGQLISQVNNITVREDNLNKGLLLFNGSFSVDMDGVTNYEQGGINKFQIWGPNRISTNNIKQLLKDANDAIFTYTATDVSGELDAFVQGGSYRESSGVKHTINGLKTTYADITFKYIVGTYEKNGNIFVDAKLINKATNQEIAKIDVDTKLKVSDGYSGSIIAYATQKGANRYNNVSEPNTTFKYFAPKVVG